MSSSTADAVLPLTPTLSPAGGEGRALKCFHCGLACREGLFETDEKSFCCQGCLAVFQILTANGLSNYYALNPTAGVRARAAVAQEALAYLDAPAVRQGLVHYSDERITRVTFRIPAIHCIACVWLLENLFRLRSGIGTSCVDFARKELSLTFQTPAVKLSEVVLLLTSLGYEPDLKFSDLTGDKASVISRSLWLQLGLAGFAFGNIMLFSIPTYLGLDAFSGPQFKRLVGYISLVLATPVLIYSAQDYWRTALVSLRQRLLTIDVPIAAGLIAIYVQSAHAVLSGRGPGYFDSLCGLLFFLLCGRVFQRKTFARLSFDRDYRSFFPLSATRLRDGKEERTSISSLEPGDRLLIRHGEIIPADARLEQGEALVDYSFVTGEADPARRSSGDYLYAGGRQIAGAIEVLLQKAVSQSYLTSLWNQDVFRKDSRVSLDNLTNRYSQRFTKLILLIAIGAGVFWTFQDSSVALKAFTSVLIVACPCALALAAPFTLGTAIRLMGRNKVFLKGHQVIENLARIDTVVFDKTGTLTSATGSRIEMIGDVSAPEIAAVLRHSTHPHAIQVAERLGASTLEVRSFSETPGCGLEGIVGGQEFWIGSPGWLESRGVLVPETTNGSTVHIAINRQWRAAFVLKSALRPEIAELVPTLSKRYDLALLSGDNDSQRAIFTPIFGDRAHFHQSPINKLEHIQKLQAQGARVLMAGDGLNDAGALKQSNVGVAVVENVVGFSPASDVIMDASMLSRLGQILAFSRDAVRTVHWSFGLSAIYNAAGVAIAARGLLEPWVCAILMPLSSASVVGFACGVTRWMARRRGL